MENWTNNGMESQNHHVERAIIMAAGIGKRMRPLTNDVPKPLVKVNGIRMIDSVIDGLHSNGIKEIYVIVGYLKEQFAYLPIEHPELTLIENPYYDTCNNISSLYVARELLCNSLILDGDQIIYNPSVLSPEFSSSGYNAVWREKNTSEWLMEVEDGIVRRCSRVGGSHGWQLYSISRWSREDGIKLKKHVEYEFERGNQQIYWDDVVMFCHFEDYTLGIKKMKEGDVVEIDDLAELIQIDKSYADYQGAKWYGK